jgi:FkbM family methyltransferase
MKSLIKRIIPRRMMPFARRIYWTLVLPSTGPGFSHAQYEKLAALKCIVSYNKYGGYCVPESSAHRPAARKILSRDVYEPRTIEFMMANCRGGDIVHAGTFFGDFLPALSKGLDRGCKVWAFEPNSESYRCAKITLEINGIADVVLANAALGDKQQYLFLQTADDDGRSLGGESRIIEAEPGTSTKGEMVPIVTIDDAVGQDRNVSLLQLDVEGHEKEALAGGLGTIRRCLPTIILEVRPGSQLISSDWFLENIMSLGYRKITDVHGNFVFSCKHWQPPSKFTRQPS